MNNYMPLIANASPIAAQGEANDSEQALFQLIATHTQQRRAVCVLDSVLCRVARQHAEDMSRHNFFSHTNLSGHGPNWRIRQAGYTLPDFYGKADDANQCESIAGGYPTPDGVLAAWLRSESHRVHVLGQLDTYVAQTHVGVGYAFGQDSDFVRYWVFLSATVSA
jgi:uncharacterized protein YkwD